MLKAFHILGIFLLFAKTKGIYQGCIHSPCANGGTCYPDPTGNGTACLCPVGFTGPTCTQIDLCPPNTCANGAQCIPDVHNLTFHCNCLPGFSGHNCSSVMHPCDSNPCMNGTCEDHTSNYVCRCFPGYSGALCESYVGLCAGSPCTSLDHHAKCSEEDDAYQCKCSSDDYFGLNCEAPTKDCADDEDSYCICTVNDFPVKFPIPTPVSYEGINWRDIVTALLGILLGWLLGTVLLHCCKCCFAEPVRKRKPWSRPQSVQSNATVTSNISSQSNNKIAPVEAPSAPMNVYRAAFGDELTHTIAIRKSEETYITGKQDWSQALKK